MPIKTIFLDRDGVINKDIGYLYKIAEFEFIDGIFEACLHFEKLGYKIIVVTNQSGISRGYYNANQYKYLTNWMIRQFNYKNIDILDIFHCPHEAEENCNCRKPKPGMLNKAQNKYNIDMENSWMIGDKERDILAARCAGIRNTILISDIQKVAKSEAKHITNSLKKIKEIIII